MQRFFFDRAHGRSYRKDVTGADFGSAEAALLSAVNTASEIAAAMKAASISLEGQSIIVRDASGAKVREVALSNPPDTPREGSLRFADLDFERLEVACAKCGRHGGFSVNMLIVEHGPRYRVTTFLSDVIADCTKKNAGKILGACEASLPQLINPKASSL